jgi:predicted PurR-regulated permease PerM
MSPEAVTHNRERVKRWDQVTKVIVIVLLVVLAGTALYLVRIVFVPLIIGAIMAYILSPLVGLATARLRIPRGLATAILYLLLLAILIPLPASLVPWGVRQITFLRDEFTAFIRYLDEVSADTIDIVGMELRIGDITDEITGQLLDAVSSLAPQSLEIVFSAAETLLLIIFTLLIGFYLTRDASKFIEWFEGLAPPEYREDLGTLRTEIGVVWSSFLRGQVILALVVGVLLTGASAIIGLPQPLLMGVLGGFLEFLPSVGHAIWLMTASVVALVAGSTTLPVSNFVFLLIVIGFHFLYTQFDLNFLIPRIIGREVNLHPMVVIIGIIVGAQVGGVLGVALAAPTIASLRIIGRYVYARLLDLDPFAGGPTFQEGALSTHPPTAPTPALKAVRRLRQRTRKGAASGDAGHDDPRR